LSARIVDAGCGRGGLVRALHSAGFSNLAAFDVADAAVEAARPYVREAWRSACESVPKPASSYDAVISSMVIEHCIDPPGAVREHFRLLKPGGVLLIVTDNAWWHTLTAMRNWLRHPARRERRIAQPIDGDFTFWEFRGLLRTAGFSVEHVFFLGGFPLGESAIQRICGRGGAELAGLRYFSTRMGFVAEKRPDRNAMDAPPTDPVRRSGARD
jgi:SAM-dependent methyltransferase